MMINRFVPTASIFLCRPAECRRFWSPQPNFLHAVDVGGWNAAERALYLQFMAAGQFFDSPPYAVIAARPGPTRTRSRAGIVKRKAWHHSPEYAEFHRQSGIDDYVLSFWTDPADPAGITDAQSIHRAVGDRPFGAREVRLIHLLHSELGPMIGRQLASAADPSPSALPPRVRQVLDCLLEGDGEKQIAARLRLSRSTVNIYVGRIYRHFRVNSRAELLARWVRFARPGRCS